EQPFSRLSGRRDRPKREVPKPDHAQSTYERPPRVYRFLQSFAGLQCLAATWRPQECQILTVRPVSRAISNVFADLLTEAQNDPLVFAAMILSRYGLKGHAVHIHFA